MNDYKNNFSLAISYTPKQWYKLCCAKAFFPRKHIIFCLHSGKLLYSTFLSCVLFLSSALSLIAFCTHNNKIIGEKRKTQIKTKLCTRNLMCERVIVALCVYLDLGLYPSTPTTPYNEYCTLLDYAHTKKKL